MITGYLPGQLYNLDASRYGKGFDLRDLIDTLHAHGICAIGDIVINHRTAGKQDLKGHWNVFDGGVTDKRLAWGAWAVRTFFIHSRSNNILGCVNLISLHKFSTINKVEAGFALLQIVVLQIIVGKIPK